jgi:hypothetical protein
VKQNGSVIDRKHVPVRVVLEEPEDFLEFFTRASIPGYLSGQTDDLQVVEETLPSNLKCKNERQSKSNGNHFYNQLINCPAVAHLRTIFFKKKKIDRTFKMKQNCNLKCIS